MTTPEALDLAITLLREKQAMDSHVARFAEKPELARHVDSHALHRYQRHTEAITRLSELKRRESSPLPLGGVGGGPEVQP